MAGEIAVRAAHKCIFSHGRIAGTDVGIQPSGGGLILAQVVVGVAQIITQHLTLAAIVEGGDIVEIFVDFGRIGIIPAVEQRLRQPVA